jgi:hypothetical protein
MFHATLAGMKTHRKPKRERDILVVELQPKVRALLDEIKRRDGVPLRAQLERAIVLWAQSRGIEASL